METTIHEEQSGTCRDERGCYSPAYGGANNTGADIRIITVISDVRAALGDKCAISVATVDRASTAKTLDGIAGVRYSRAALHLSVGGCCAWSLVMMCLCWWKQHFQGELVERSAVSLSWGAWCAKRLGKAAIAYAVDAGTLSPFHRFLVRNVCNELDLIIVRTESARQVLQKLGVRKSIDVTTDTAFQFHAYPDTRSRTIVGMAPVEFFQWRFE